MTYLRAAQASIDQSDLSEAWIGLGRAETRLLPRTVPASRSAEPITSGAVGHVRAARHALTDRDVGAAVQSTNVEASAGGGAVRPAGMRRRSSAIANAWPEDRRCRR